MLVPLFKSMSQVIIQQILQFQAPQKRVFEHITSSREMTSYKGFFLIPGIREVESSDPSRKTGTVDLVKNSDGSSHRSLTVNFTHPTSYRLELTNIQGVGWRAPFTALIESIAEDWSFEGDDSNCRIDRKFQINYQHTVWRWLYFNLILKPLFEIAFRIHYRHLQKALDKIS